MGAYRRKRSLWSGAAVAYPAADVSVQRFKIRAGCGRSRSAERCVWHGLWDRGGSCDPRARLFAVAGKGTDRIYRSGDAGPAVRIDAQRSKPNLLRCGHLGHPQCAKSGSVADGIRMTWMPEGVILYGAFIATSDRLGSAKKKITAMTSMRSNSSRKRC